MNEQAIYLKSTHPYNFRSDKENPKVIGFVKVTPENLPPRPCFKVLYESDGTVDYIAFSDCENGHWVLA